MSKKNGKSQKQKGRRYTVEERAEVIRHVEEHNQTHGRGGMASAARRFGITPLTISNWLNRRSAPVSNSNSIEDVLTEIGEVNREIVAKEEELRVLKRRYAQLKSKL